MPPTSLTRLQSYHYELPEDLIADRPVVPRDQSRLMIVDRSSGKISHSKFYELPQFLDSSDTLVLNNSRVFPARLLGRRLRSEAGRSVLGGKVEFFLLKRTSELEWEGLFRSSVGGKLGVRFQVENKNGETLLGEIVASGGRLVKTRFDKDPVAGGFGEIPLPPYIKRTVNENDRETYQTVYAKKEGSVAAPTAGLHFTDRVFSDLKKKGVQRAEVTLHVGLGTFSPVKVEDVREHEMHFEAYEVSEETARFVNRSKEKGSKIVAVGTTSVRVLESAWDERKGRLRTGFDETDLFIYPGGKRFQIVDKMLTNFHLPCSTLLMLVCAFAERDLIFEAYEEAIREKYRFFSYGDAMLIV